MQAAINRKRWPVITAGCRHTVGLKVDGKTYFTLPGEDLEALEFHHKNQKNKLF